MEWFKGLVNGMNVIKVLLLALLSVITIAIVTYIVTGSLFGVATNGTITVMDKLVNESLNSSRSDWTDLIEQFPPAVRIVIGLIAVAVIFAVFGYFIWGKGGKGGMNKASY